MYVCLCNALTDRQIREARNRGAQNVSHVFRSTGTKPECGKCVHCVRDILRENQQLSSLEKAS
ncbi:(2Fe-2S)-binding protein [Insolitispirillum peregrinum]|uniref:Bacterioferritin-associated ferredoxin n=1 Tax=Insolitispirillum peregrinum TaxID=80876 RepID=A0A1N7JHA9_9PROT|nr:(2Fe-2S)-binding protein [Insolitispirillum peregrinum]SIS48616.1 bacterioferritin-associated ferredoxin [Insolitispirillum peregrinum]